MNSSKFSTLASVHFPTNVSATPGISMTIERCMTWKCVPTKIPKKTGLEFFLIFEENFHFYMYSDQNPQSAFTAYALMLISIVVMHKSTATSLFYKFIII